jgi:glycosidase
VRVPKVSVAQDLRLTVTRDRSAPKTFSLRGHSRATPHKVALRSDHAQRIYQLPVRTWAANDEGHPGRGTLSQLTSEVFQSIRQLGIDVVWLTGVVEQAAPENTDPDVVKGEAGSYYALRDSWDISPQIGTLAEFTEVLDRAHEEGLRVLIDFVPNHTARRHVTDVACKQPLNHGTGDNVGVFFSTSNSYYYLPGTTFTPPRLPWVSSHDADGIFDTNPLTPEIEPESPARVTGNDIALAEPSSEDWFETTKLNYGWDFRARRKHYSPRPKTWDTMADIGRYWLELGVDGFRVDFAHAVPLEFWSYWSDELRRVQPEALLIAEAYESDERMKIPGFTYQGLLDAGFDSVYNSQNYWRARAQFATPGDMRSALPTDTPLTRPEILRSGKFLTHYLENHDEVRAASRHMTPRVSSFETRARLALAWTAWTALLPGHFLIHGGQEVGEEALITGPFAGDNGRTSIFDFVPLGEATSFQNRLRDRHKKLLSLKALNAFAAPHSESNPSWIDLDEANGSKDSARWVGAYLRYAEGRAWLVVMNSDPFDGHEATIHLTPSSNADPLGALAVAGITNTSRRYYFREVFSHEGWEPKDPAINGRGIPGSVLWREGGIPSGLYLGEIPPATTYVFEIGATYRQTQ